MSNSKLKVIVFVLFFFVVSAAIWLVAYSEYVFSLVLQGKSHVELRLCEYYEEDLKEYFEDEAKEAASEHYTDMYNDPDYGRPEPDYDDF